MHETTADAWSYFEYDLRGNCTGIHEPDGWTYFEYNGAGLIGSIKYKTGVANYFYYDAFLRRYAIEESAGLRYFTWDRNGMKLLSERDALGNVVAEYAHGWTPIEGIGSLAAARKVEVGTTYYQYPAYDHRGTVMRLVDDAGVVTAYYEYDAWGNSLRGHEAGPLSPFRYQSDWRRLADSGADLYLSPARLYWARAGRFLQVDPARGRMRHPAYAYAGQRPLLSVDPTGLIVEGPPEPDLVADLPPREFGETQPVKPWEIPELVCNPCDVEEECAKPMVKGRLVLRYESKVLDPEAKPERYVEAVDAWNDWVVDKITVKDYFAMVWRHETERILIYEYYGHCWERVLDEAEAKSCQKCCEQYLAYLQAKIDLCRKTFDALQKYVDKELYPPGHPGEKAAHAKYLEAKGQAEAQAAYVKALLEVYAHCQRYAYAGG